MSDGSEDRPVYHDGMRDLQRRFGSEALADRLARHRRRTAFTDEDRAFIEGLEFFFLATADADGFPDCSYKGGAPGYMRATGPAELAFPSLDGNGMYRSLGNIAVNPQIGLLFISFETPRRLRVNGRARIVWDDPLMAEHPGAELMVLVDVEAIFTNCPRYIHREGGRSEYLDDGRTPPKTPDWKTWPEFRDVLPKKDGS
ncbi:MAG: pyridoxamine 5'-phosphate oxidase family protein [Pseudomonadota bacterium]